MPAASSIAVSWESDPDKLEEMIMKVLTLVVLVFACSISAAAQKTGQPDFQAMEKGAWDAFSKGDGKYFDSLIADDGVVFNGSALSSKADLVKEVNSKPCDVKSYSFSNFKVTTIDNDATLVTYSATQDGTCGGQAMPAKVMGSTIYVKRNGKWLAFYHQESPVTGM
jgi:hypothetical protein